MMRSSKVVRSLRAADKAIGNKFSKRLIELSSAGIKLNSYELEFSMLLTESQYSGSQYLSVDEFELAYPGHGIDLDVVGILYDTPFHALTIAQLGGMAWCALACDSARYQLAGLLLDATHFVATDGMRMHCVAHNFLLSGDTSAIIPICTIKAVQDLAKIWNDDSLWFSLSEDTRSIVFYGKFWKLTTKLVEGRFPAWRYVMPNYRSDYDCTEKLSNGLIEYCKGLIKSTALKNKVKISNLTRDERKTFESVWASIEIAKNVVVDAKYACEAIAGSDNVYVWAGKSSQPVVMVCADRQAVIMPMARVA